MNAQEKNTVHPPLLIEWEYTKTQSTSNSDDRKVE